MKSLVCKALSIACSGICLSGNHQADSFLVVAPHLWSGAARTALRRLPSSFNGEVVHPQSSSLRPGKCRLRMRNPADEQGRPAKGFGQPPARSKAPSKGKRARESTAREPVQTGSANRQLFMQFTCERCDGVSQYMINKNAYEEGIVICTCKTCGVRHLLADNLKKMDFPQFGNNIEEYMRSKGSPEEVKKGSAPGLTPEVLDKYDVDVGDDGVVSFTAKADDPSF